MTKGFLIFVCFVILYYAIMYAIFKGIVWNDKRSFKSIMEKLRGKEKCR